MNRYVALLALGALAACKGKETGPRELGPPASMTLSGPLTAPANTELTGVTLTVVDANNQPVPDQVVTFSVQAGGGSIESTTATTGPNGAVTVPAWRMGKLDVPQVLRATTGSVVFNINASVQTSYDIVVRYFGSGQPTPAQQALFTNAAARIQAVITGDVLPITTGQFDISPCTPGTTTVINETIDDVVIYVQLANIDGNGQIIASAGPCFVRNGKNAQGQGGADSLTTVIGTMRFDTSDLPNLREETILHEMLHVIGVGSMWDAPPNGWGLVEGEGTATPRYIGEQGRLGCQEVGGTVTCLNSVPVEDTLGPGTAGVHWEENVFDNELMTGFIEVATTPMPFSLLTIRSLRDIGYAVNLANFDNYTKPFGALRAEGGATAASRAPWEQVSPVPIRTVDQRGRVGRELRRRSR